jgi:hypothetical protein
MDTVARRSPTKKGHLVDDGLITVRPKYRRALALDLLYLRTRVSLPPSWTTPEQRIFVAMDQDEDVGAPLRPAGRDLVAAVARLCDHLIPAAIEGYLGRHRAFLDRGELESLRRGRGPAAGRDAIFGSCGCWPSNDPEYVTPSVREAVDSALDNALACRRSPRPVSLLVEARFAELSPAVAAEVHRYADRKRLNRRDREWLVSEVSAQLDRSVARGLQPHNVARWTWSTAKAKLNRLCATEPPPRHHLVEPFQDDDMARVELISTLKETGKRLAKRAADLHKIGDRDNAVIHDISAAIVGSGDADGIVFFVESGDLTELIEDYGLDLSPDRLMAAIELIRATLRDALS